MLDNLADDIHYLRLGILQMISLFVLLNFSNDKHYTMLATLAKLKDLANDIHFMLNYLANDINFYAQVSSKRYTL